MGSERQGLCKSDCLTLALTTPQNHSLFNRQKLGCLEVKCFEGPQQGRGRARIQTWVSVTLKLKLLIRTHAASHVTHYPNVLKCSLCSFTLCFQQCHSSDQLS